MKKIIALITLLYIGSNSVKAQVLISNQDEINPTPHSSAVLEVRSDKKGILLPRVALTNNTDDVTVPSPIDGVLVADTNSEDFMFWLNNRWYKDYNVDDAADVIAVTTNVTSGQSNATTVSSFPSTMPMFTIGDNTSGWTDLGVQTNVNINKPTNTVFIKAEGMAAIDNISGYTAFQFAIGVFVDDKLVQVRKYYDPAAGQCSWKQFNISGMIENLAVSPSGHTIKVMAYNLPRLSTSYTKITYGNVATSSCDNLNTTMAKISVKATVTQ